MTRGERKRYIPGTKNYFRKRLLNDLVGGMLICLSCITVCAISWRKEQNALKTSKYVHRTKRADVTNMVPEMCDLLCVPARAAEYTISDV